MVRIHASQPFMFKHRKYNPKSWDKYLTKIFTKIELGIYNGVMFKGKRCFIVLTADKIGIVCKTPALNGINEYAIKSCFKPMSYFLRRYRISRKPFYYKLVKSEENKMIFAMDDFYGFYDH